MDTIELVQKLQALRKFQTSIPYAEFLHRYEMASELARLVDGLNFDDELEGKSLRQKLAQLLPAAGEHADPVEPTGVITFIIPSTFAAHFFFENLARNILAGNVGFFYFPSLPSEVEKFVALASENLRSAFTISEDSFATKFLIQHPTVAAVQVTGSFEECQTWSKLFSPWEKKLQALVLGQSTYLSLDIVEDATVTDFFKRSTLSASPKRFYALEKFENENLEKFVQIAKQNFQPRRVPLEQSSVNKILEQIREENGEILTGGKVLEDGSLEPTVVRNLSNCSDLYQTYLPLPVVFFHTIKYPLDVQKWLDQSAGHEGLFIQAEDQLRAENLAKKIKRSKLWVNEWFEADSTILNTSKQSFGIQNTHWDGEFFSNACF